MSFGVPEVTRHKRPPKFDTGRFSRFVVDKVRVTLPDVLEVEGFYNVQPNNARFWFEVDGAWYSGPVLGLAGHHRGLMDDNGTRAYVDLRKFVLPPKRE